MRSISLTQAARAELIRSADWYECEVPGLGRRFLAAIDSLTIRIIENPLDFPTVFETVIRAVLGRFPHSIFFVIDDDDSLLVIACFHASRDPTKWQARI